MSTTTLREPLAVRLARTAAGVRHDAVLVALDVALISAAYFAVLLARFEGVVPETWLTAFVRFLPLAVALHLLAFGLSGSYGAMWQHAGVAEARRLLLGGASAGAVLAALAAPGILPQPLSVVLMGSVIATGLVAVQRFHARLFAFHRGGERDASRVVVLGAGETGANLVREMARDPHAGLAPVALLDDDPDLQGRNVAGVPVLGPLAALPAVAQRHRADKALLAMPSASRATARRAATLADEARVTLKTLPRVSELVAGLPGVADVRDIAIEDLLGRDPVASDAAPVRRALEGRRVLIVGAGGSIGSEIARQVDGLGAAELLLLDNDETHLFDVAATVRPDAVQLLLDIRDRDQVHQAMARWAPDVVYHAAARKHVPLLEDHPVEAAHTNVLGTQHVLEAARETGVRKLVFVSTDKAVRPRNVMGASKRVGEQLVERYRPEDASWCAVRFGNVLGSRGSVVPTFVRQIRDGGPVTVTDPQMTRYFMSIPEAVELVLQSGALARGGEVFMLDMGEPVRILDLAERMIRLAGHEPGRDVPIRITGPRPGEKLAEELAEPDAHPQPTAHPAISALHPGALPADRLDEQLSQIRLHLLEHDQPSTAAALLALAHDERTELHLPSSDEDREVTPAWSPWPT